LVGFAGCAEEGVLIRPLTLLNLFVSVVMLSIGLRVSTRELVNVVRNRGLVTRALLTNCVLIPALGFLLVHLFPLAPTARIGILLLAAIPGTPIALQFTRQAKTRLAFAAAMTFALSVVSVAMTPLALRVIPETARQTERPVVLLVANIVLYIALPLACGVLAAHHLPKIAHRMVLPLGLVASALFILLMQETRLLRADAYASIRGGGAVIAMFLLLLLSMLIGWFMGGPDRDSRRVLATSTGMRSVIVVLYVARYCFPGTNVHAVPIAYASLMVPTNLVFHLVCTVWNKLWPAAVSAG
jgi:bile acid:Na+ symporter, BASS family